jgi:DNA-binding cell septation regulator SpoVG
VSAAFQTLDCQERRSGALRAFAKVKLPSGVIMHGIAILVGQHGPYAMPPSTPMIGRDRMVVKNGNGKTVYQPVVEFTTKEAAKRFSDAVIEAIRASNPEVLEP